MKYKRLTRKEPLLPSIATAVLAALVALAIDQITKSEISEFLEQSGSTISVTPFLFLRFSYTTGISLDVFEAELTKWPAVLAVMQLVLFAIMLWWATITHSVWEASGIGLVAGGALGNLLDRIRHGGVTDFIDLYIWNWHWPTFNFADAAIATGVIFLIATNLYGVVDSRNEAGSSR